jgi:hypothetical protein
MNSPRRLPGWKRWLFRLAALCLALLLVEGLTAAVWHLANPELSWTTLRKRQRDLQDSAALTVEGTEAIHPYLGWVFDPQAMSAAQVAGDEAPVNELGFLDDGPTVRQRSPGTKLVGITGGSVALQMSWLSEATFKERLRQHPAFAGQEIEFVRLAMSGYKQPQQLMSLAYLLTLGGELDYLVNIDGYNELALAVEENYAGGVFLTYPRMWNHRLLDVVDPRTTSVSFQLLTNRAQRQGWAIWMGQSWLRDTHTANYLWFLNDMRLWRQQNSLAEQLQTHRLTNGRSFAQDGPDNHLPDDRAALEAAIDVWARTSQQLHRLCAANGIGYLHVLQPNQYHLGSKPLSDLERDKFYNDKDRLSICIQRGYPLAIARGSDLRSDGLPFADLTQLFAAETDTIYCDWFCHYNQRGNDLLAVAVADALGQFAAVDSRQDDGTP